MKRYLWAEPFKTKVPHVGDPFHGDIYLGKRFEPPHLA